MPLGQFLEMSQRQDGSGAISACSRRGLADGMRTFRRALATLPRRMASAETGFDRSMES
jgi:hypothetical protein